MYASRFLRLSLSPWKENQNFQKNSRGGCALYYCSANASCSLFLQKELHSYKNNRGEYVLYYCSAHASCSLFPRKDLRSHKNSRGEYVLCNCSGYASLLPHQPDLQRRQKNRQKKR